MAERRSTGVDALDHLLSGGLEVGSLIALSAAPASQSELVLAQLAAGRETLYLTTQRPAAEIRSALGAGNGPGDPAVTVTELDANAPIDHATRLLESVPEAGVLVVDPADGLERAGDGYTAYVNAVRERVADRAALAVFHCLDGRDVPPRRDTTEYLADVVFDLETAVYGSAVENRLFVPKVRGGEALEEVVKLQLVDDVSVDTSRDIS